MRLLQSLSIGARECIFLHRLRTAVRSLVSDLFDVTTDSEGAILNPSPSTEKLITEDRTPTIRKFEISSRCRKGTGRQTSLDDHLFMV